LRREQAMRQHLFEKKPSTRTRRLAGDVDVHPGDAKKIKRLLAER
jgi:large subunit ribosomal protein L35